MHTPKRPKHILHVLPNLKMGGMERALVTLIGKTDQGLLKHFICCLEDPQADSPLMKALNPEQVAIFYLRKKQGLDFSLVGRLAGIVRKEKIDIVHARNWASILYSCLSRLATFRRCSVIVDIRGIHDDKHYRLLGYLGPLINIYVAVTKDIAGHLRRKAGIPEGKIRVIYNGVDLDSLAGGVPPGTRQAVREAWDIPPEAFVIGTVGRLVPVKNYPCLLKAFEKIIGQKKEARLLLVGDGPERARLEGLAQDLGVGARVIFTGLQYPVVDFYRAMDLFVLPSFKEGLSNTILEAMAADVPVIASKVGGNNEIIKHGVNGLLFSSNNQEELVAQMDLVLDNPGLAGQLKKHAQETLNQRFSLAQTVNSYLDIYEYS